MNASPNIEAVLTSIDTAETHVRSEYVRDLAGTMATVAAQPHYAVTAAPGVVSVISGRDGVARFYEEAHKFVIPEASRFLTQIATDWYVFVENMPTRKWVADGSLGTAHTATLLVTDSDGVKGEFIWERPASLATTASDTTSLPLGSLRSVSLHEELLAAICDGDKAAIGAVLDATCTWAERDYLSDADGGAILELHGKTATADYLAQWHGRYNPERVSILNRQATNWYVFAEELWIVRPDKGEQRQFRKAVIYPLDADGKFRGAIGFGTDLDRPSFLTDFCVGQAFWPESEVDARGGLRSRTRSPGAM